MNKGRARDGDADVAGLRWWNLGAAGLHTALAGGLWYLYSRQEAAKRRVELTLPNLARSEDGSALSYKLDNEAVGKVDVAVPIVGFFGLTALAHALYGTDFAGAGWYTDAVRRGSNVFRWVEYGLSASVMAGVVAALDGTRSADTLALIVAATAVMQLQGSVVEDGLRTGERAAWFGASGAGPYPQPRFAPVAKATVSGWMLLAATWAVILTNFNRLLREARRRGAPVPAWLVWVGFTQLAFFSCFGAVQVAQISSATAESSAVAAQGGGLPRGRKAPSLAGTERSYLLLSLLAKASLGGLVGYGLMQQSTAAAAEPPQDEEDE